MTLRRWMLAAVAVSGVAHAAPDEPHARELGAVVVTATRLPPGDGPAAASATVLDSERIRRRDAVTLPELLRELPGAYVDQVGAPGGVSSLYLRGADPNHTTVLLDGVKINDPTNTRGGSFDLSGIDPYDLQRVELVPGAASSVYGSDAMAGVMNLLTGAGGQTGLRLGGGAGGRGYRRGYASLSGDGSTVSSYLSGSALNDGRAADSAYHRLRTGSVKLRGDNGNASWSAALRLQDRTAGAFPEDSGGPVHAVRRGLETRDTQAGVWSLAGTIFTGEGRVRGYANGFLSDEDTASPGVAPGVRDALGLPKSISSTRFRRTTAGAVWTSEAARPLTASLGVEYVHERGDARSTFFFGPVALPGDFTLTRATRSVFGEARYRLTDRAIGEVSARADDIDRFGTRTTGRVRGSYALPGNGFRIEATMGTGFKAPSFFALGNPLVGNPQLRPEESRTAELAVASAGATAQRIALFRTRYTNLVDFDAGPPPRLVNRAQVDIRGVEYAASVRAGPWAAHASATALSFDVPGAATPLRNRPKFKAAAGVAYDAGGSWSAGLHGAWRGRLFDSAIPTGGMYLQPDFIVDGSVSYALRDARISVVVDNILTRDYEQFIGFPAPRRRVRLEVALPLMRKG